MKNVPPDQRKEFGLVLNAFKIIAKEKYRNLKTGASNNNQQHRLVSPGDYITVDTRHPLSIVYNQ